MQTRDMHRHPRFPDKLQWGARMEIGDTVRAGDIFAATNDWQVFTSVGHVILPSDKTYWIRPDVR